MQGTTSDTILIVDDSPENLTVLSELLRPAYKVRAATSGAKALRIVGSAPQPDLVLLDVMMPDMDGYEVFERMRAEAQTREIPVIFVTAMDSSEAEIRGLEVGAVDYITKPIVPPIVLARVHTQLELKHARDRLQNQNSYLEAEVERRMLENEQIKEISVRALAYLAETRDADTGNHILRTQGYVRELAMLLREHPHFAGQLTSGYIKSLSCSAPLHDIGKVGIPDAILRKPGPLSSDEWEIMKSHARLGGEAIAHAQSHAEQSVDFLATAREITHWHHEKWDGSGYPDGLAGEDIPLSARIMALADVFDALISKRVYKPEMSYDEARGVILAERGKSFDPRIVDVFNEHYDAFCAIAETHRDREVEAHG